MCAPDPNAGRREAARVENNRRHAEFKANSIKQWNKEADFKQNLKTIRGMGRSRTQADFQELAVQAQNHQGLFQTQKQNHIENLGTHHP